MEKEKLTKLLLEHGDAVITYRSTNSNKLKYNVCTLEFDNEHIQEKRNRAEETDETLLMFCWDTDSYRLMKYKNVTKVEPLSSLLKNKK